MKFQNSHIACVFLSSLAFVPTLITAQTRTLEDVQQIAQKYFGQKSTAVTRGDSQIEYFPSSAFIDEELGQESFYLCNLPSDGFVIVSTQENLPEVIGYSSSAYHPGMDLPAGLVSMMQTYAGMSEGFSALAPLSAQTSVDPMLSTKWNQNDPYNRMCPRDGQTRSMVGCVATAAAQVMKYYKWPEKKGTGKINYVTDSRKISVSVDLSENALAWDLMLDEYIPDQFSNAQANAVAKLMYTVGAACRMDYSYAESGSSLIYAAQGLSQYFDYDKDMCLLFGDVMPADTWSDIIVKEINQSRPVMFSGADAKGAGHAFVLDGYELRDGNIYYHVNWGWSGVGDGNYLVTNLTPSGSGIGAGMASYNNTQLILLNCQPDDGKPNPLYAQVDELSLSKTNFNSGEDILFDMDLKNVYCMLTNEFSGSIQFEFVDESGTVCSEESAEGVSIPSDQGLVGSLSGFHTKALADGIYSVRFTLKKNDGQKIECIPNKPWPKIVVGNVASAIANVGQDFAAPAVHNLMGAPIKNASKQSLPAGFYVIDSQKVIIR